MPKDFGPFDTRREVFAHLKGLYFGSAEQRRRYAQHFRERFLGRLRPDTRRVIESAEDKALELDADLMDTGHLLAGVLSVMPVHGVSLSDVEPRLARGFSTEDATALATLGISLDDVVERAEQSFGPDALRPHHRDTVTYRVRPTFEYSLAWTAAASDAGGLWIAEPEHIFAALLDPAVSGPTTRAIAIMRALAFDVDGTLDSLRDRLGSRSDRAFFEGRGFAGRLFRVGRWAASFRGETEHGGT